MLEVIFNSPSRVTVRSPDVTVLRDWQLSNRVFTPGAEFTPQFKKKQWDGYFYPGQLARYKGGGGALSVSLGFWPRLRSDLGLTGDVSRPDLPLYRLPELLAGLEFPPRDYQIRSLRDIAVHGWGRVSLATNAGKGVIMGLAAGLADRAGMKTLILADEIEVFRALQKELTDVLGDIGLVESGSQTIPSQTVVCAMVPTLHARVTAPKDGSRAWVKEDEDPDLYRTRQLRRTEWAAWLNGFGMVLLDEADRATASRWRTLLHRTFNSFYRIGFSGSFEREGDYPEVQQEELLGPILETKVRNKELIGRGISARPLVTLHQFQQRLALGMDVEEWYKMPGPERRRWAYEHGVHRNEVRHALIAALLNPASQTAIVVDQLVHGRLLAEYLPDTEFLQGSDSKEARGEVLEQFRDGAFTNLVCTRILDRGTNLLGHAVGLIFASGAGSATQTIQRIGRGLRRGGGKEFLFLHDIVDTPPASWIRGAVRCDPYAYFVRASRKRIEVYNEEEFDIEIRQHV